MSTIKIKREHLKTVTETLSETLEAEKVKALMASVLAYAQPNSEMADGTIEALYEMQHLMVDAIDAIEALQQARLGESDGFVNGVNQSAGTCRIVADTAFGYMVIDLADYDPKFDTLFIDSEEA